MIGAFEAQAILMALEISHDLKKPLTHDLFFNFLHQYDIEIQKVLIHHFEEGLFEAYLYSKQNHIEKRHVSRVSDAVALAVRANAPIYIDNRILLEAGVLPEGIEPFVIEDILRERAEDEEDLGIIEMLNLDSQKKQRKQTSEYDMFSIEELREKLEQTLAEENFELAAKIRDEINKRNQNT